MADSQKWRCLVTGGAGFIGSHIVELLLEAGHSVAVLDDLSTGKLENLPEGVQLYQVDVNDDTTRVFKEFQPNVLIHQAAQVSVSVSVQNPEEDAHVNIIGSINIIKTAVEHGVKKFIYASSGASYGNLEDLPLKEEMRPMPVSPYGISKHTVEHYLRSAAKEWGLEWVALRYSNVYGPRQDPHGEAGVVAIFTHKLLKNESPIIFDDGELTRDYIFVKDVARANLAALEKDCKSHPDPIFNVSTGISTTVNSLFESLRKSLGVEINATYGPPRPGDVRHSLLAPDRANKELNWKAEVGIDEGMGRTVEFFAPHEKC